MIHSCGLERFYEIREDADIDSQAAAWSGRAFEEFDDPAFHRLYSRPISPLEIQTELYLESVRCSACVWLVERLASAVDGVIESRLDMRRSIVRIRWDPSVTSLSVIAAALDSLGYTPHPPRGASLQKARVAEDRKLLIKIGVAGACFGNAMLISFALYGGMLHGMSQQHERFFIWMSTVVGMVALLWPGSVFYRGALAALQTRSLHMDLPVAIGLTAGGVSGIVSTLSGNGHTYFDSITAVIFLLLIGRWIQRREQRAAGDAVELLYSMTPTSVSRIDPEDGTSSQAPIESIGMGDIVEVVAGETVPVDGLVLSGESSVDESFLTGEARPITVGEGESVRAGSVNLSGPLRIRTEAAGEDTRVGRLMQMVEESAARRAPIVRLADRVAGWFVLIVISLALMTAIGWAVVAPARAVSNAMALLIVTCPCALGLATPLAVIVAVGRAARQGIFIKGGDALERVARPGLLLLDKTGTITEGRVRLVEWSGDDASLALAAALETAVAHPIAHAIAGAVQEEPQRTLESVRHTQGAGVEGVVDGASVAVGSVRFIERFVKTMPSSAYARVERDAAEANSSVLVAIDGQLRGVATLGDPIREDAQESIRNLIDRGWRVGVLSGDRQAVVESVAHRLGVEFETLIGDATPERKLEVVEEASGDGPVMMVGDGVNDAAALAAATVGVSMHGGAEASLSAADVFLRRAGLHPIVELVEGSDRTVRAIRTNITASLCYNVVSGSLAIAGIINPLIAAILMPLSSLTVVSLSYRARTFEDSSCR